MVKKAVKATPTSVVLAISNGLLRDSIKASLASVPDLEVVAEARDAEETQAVLESGRGQVVLLGVTLAGRLPTPVTEIAADGTKFVLIVPADMPAERIVELASRWAQAVVTNDIHMADLIRVLQLVSRGMLVLPASLRNGGAEPEMDSYWYRQANNVRLAPRERELLQLLAQGFTDKEASKLLGVGHRTVHTYLGRIRGKLGAANRVHAAALAVAARLVSPHRSNGADRTP